MIQSQLEEGVKIKDIASILSVSENTIYRRMKSYGVSSLALSDISDSDLDGYVSDLSSEFPFFEKEEIKYKK